jgi:preprotein translocase subunit SecD
MNRNYFLIATILVSLVLFAFVYPQGVNKGIDVVNATSPKDIPHIPESWQTPFRLGLDLLGGVHLVYQADLSQVPEAERADAMNGIRDVVDRRVNFFGVAEPLVQVSGDDRLIVELAGIQDINSAIKLIGETPFVEFKELQGEGDTAELVSTGLNGRHVKRAQLGFDPQFGSPLVNLELTDEGKDLFAQITKRNIGKQVAIFLDGALISAPVVQVEITTGQAVISGGLGVEEARLLATRLNSGALPVPIHLISQQLVGASLGAESINASLKAAVWGLILVAIFMVAFYRLPGFLAVLALCIYIIINLAIFKLLGVTLTLAGIAGFILSLGMSVDANVLIFSRMREEIKAGKSVLNAVAEGFSRAWLSIRDSHVTTIISSVVLYVFTTSIVKGFALTLGIGVVVSLFSAVVVTHAFLRLCVGPWFEKRKWLFK